MEKENILEEERVFEFSLSDNKSSQVRGRNSVQPASSAAIFAKVNQKPKVQTFVEKAQTSQPDVKKELKRGSMKDKWGLSLAYKVDGAKISLLGGNKNKSIIIKVTACSFFFRSSIILLVEI